MQGSSISEDLLPLTRPNLVILLGAIVEVDILMNQVFVWEAILMEESQVQVLPQQQLSKA